MLPQSIEVLADAMRTALTPAFLLARTAGFINVFTTRLGRVADRVNEIDDIVAERRDEQASRAPQLAYLRRRTLALECAVGLAVVAAICTCLAILGLLGGAVRDEFNQRDIVWLFVGAVFALVAALLAYAIELTFSGISMLRQMKASHRKTAKRSVRKR
ncbi:DUF2721 domain-containing protein [Pandoraea sputorum]|uniref:DUF2721 domain-containing protein n=1 Tax=Pandoraea sputorum TaxID=93222 RepID=UPI002F3EDEE1